MQRFWRCLLISVVVVCRLTPAAADLLRLDYDSFTIWLDCAWRGAVTFRYNAQRDQGTLPHVPTFRWEPAVPPQCQQTSAAPYRHPTQRYDRGHLMPANHLDYSARALQQSQYMTNILPQSGHTFQRKVGSWPLYVNAEEVSQFEWISEPTLTR
jgi:endonuclease G, mitochondrial